MCCGDGAARDTRFDFTFYSFRFFFFFVFTFSNRLILFGDMKKNVISNETWMDFCSLSLSLPCVHVLYSPFPLSVQCTCTSHRTGEQFVILLYQIVKTCNLNVWAPNFWRHPHTLVPIENKKNVFGSLAACYCDDLLLLRIHAFFSSSHLSRINARTICISCRLHFSPRCSSEPMLQINIYLILLLRQRRKRKMLKRIETYYTKYNIKPFQYQSEKREKNAKK